MPQTVRFEFAEQLRGKNALHFWIGVGIIALLVYAWLRGLFTQAALALGWIDPPTGYASGITTLAIDTVCLIGFGGLTLAKLCWRWLSGLADRLGFITEGVYAWASKEKTAGEPLTPLIAEPTVTRADHDRLVDAVASIERRLRKHDAALGDTAEALKAIDASLESFEELVDQLDPVLTDDEIQNASDTIARLKVENHALRRQLETQAAAPQPAEEPAQ